MSQTNIILLGAPGSGKGTIANLLAVEAQWTHFAMGDLVRQNVAAQSPEGILCQKYNAAGVLVPDKTINDMVDHASGQLFKQQAIVWDGYPRTLNQAKAFAKLLQRNNQQLHHVYLLEISRKKLQARIAGRLTCPQCGCTYHIIDLPPKVAGLCDQCHSHLVSRADDNAVTYAKRLATYEQETAPLIAYYEAQNLVTKLEAVDDPYNLVKVIMQP